MTATSRSRLPYTYPVADGPPAWPILPHRPIEIGEDPTAVYWFCNSTGEVLYIGISSNPVVRVEAHSHQHRDDWWPEVARKVMVWYPTRAAACEAETAAIGAEKPCYNKQQRSYPGCAPRGPRL